MPLEKWVRIVRKWSGSNIGWWRHKGRVLLLIVSLAADALGLGNGAGLGWKQILGAVIGLLVAAGGAWWGWGKTGKKN